MLTSLRCTGICCYTKLPLHSVHHDAHMHTLTYILVQSHSMFVTRLMRFQVLLQALCWAVKMLLFSFNAHVSPHMCLSTVSLLIMFVTRFNYYSHHASKKRTSTHLRCTDISCDIELSLHSVHNDIQVHALTCELIQCLWARHVHHLGDCVMGSQSVDRRLGIPL